MASFAIPDVSMRLGGDEFVIYVKDSGHATIMNKAGKLIREVQKLKFPGTTYLATCSVGICFLPENVFGYTYQQLFENA
ncbi:diguanylate cyclase domain-containing protein, partial [Staphylococcus aureus]